jgi:hypothetical protein
MKNDELYPIYICYLESKKMTKGAFKLAQISESMFNEFVHRYENNPDFKCKQDNLYKSIKRDINIDEILDEKDEFELFLDDLNLTTSKNSTNINDDIFDF